ncbi:MAG: 3-deoxy-D-manno-octulosonic acid transferase, partial [Verrucomicrobia bacterium]|nr:3-deoxy-D-manno-octulosonic acid transferase [Verrucomicrobiota bacterium]
MFSLLYNCALVLFALPKLLFQWSKYKERIRARLGFDLPTFERGKEVIWIHSVSVGETRAAVPLFEKLRQEHPNATLLISTTTETGLAEAKRAMPSATTHFLLPLDLSFLMRRAIRHIQPSLLLLVESDFWYHLISLAKEAGAKVVLVNGKISERSTMRFQKFPLFARKIFTPIDHLCLQSSLYETRFLQIGIPKEKITITGNLKLDHPTAKIPPSLEIPTEDPILTIGSTHSPEEEYILDALESVWKEFPRLKVLLVPRHPERFGAVANLLEAKKIPYSR